MNNSQKKVRGQRSAVKGFSIVELFVIICIVGILSVIAFIGIQKNWSRAMNERVKDNLKTIAEALESYRRDNSKYPIPETTTDQNSLCFYIDATDADCDDANVFFRQGMIDSNLLSGRYLREVPADPRTGNRYAYGVTADGKFFQAAGISKTASGSFESATVDNLQGFELPSLIRAYDGSDFVVDKSGNLPYSPDPPERAGTPEDMTGAATAGRSPVTTNDKLVPLTLQNRPHILSIEAVKDRADVLVRNVNWSLNEVDRKLGITDPARMRRVKVTRLAVYALPDLQAATSENPSSPFISYDANLQTGSYSLTLPANAETYALRFELCSNSPQPTEACATLRASADTHLPPLTPGLHLEEQSLNLATVLSQNEPRLSAPSTFHLQPDDSTPDIADDFSPGQFEVGVFSPFRFRYKLTTETEDVCTAGSSIINSFISVTALKTGRCSISVTFILPEDGRTVIKKAETTIISPPLQFSLIYPVGTVVLPKEASQFTFKWSAENAPADTAFDVFFNSVLICSSSNTKIKSDTYIIKIKQEPVSRFFSCPFFFQQGQSFSGEYWSVKMSAGGVTETRKASFSAIPAAAVGFTFNGTEAGAMEPILEPNAETVTLSLAATVNGLPPADADLYTYSWSSSSPGVNFDSSTAQSTTMTLRVPSSGLTEYPIILRLWNKSAPLFLAGSDSVGRIRVGKKNNEKF